ncbi:ComEC/Rec2 family competence protein [Candidatus Babeliales bacterium]|nr:ComEC/Rec2 family competence protein [Candidatus Babeliales bacterium]
MLTRALSLLKTSWSLPLLIAFIAGIHIQALQPSPIVILVYLALTLITTPEIELKGLAFIVGIALCGAISYLSHIQPYYDFIRTTQDGPYDILATVSDIHPYEHPFLRTKLTLTMHDLRTDAGWATLKGAIDIYLPYTPYLEIDDLIQVNALYLTQKNLSYFSLREYCYATVFPQHLSYLLIEKQRWSPRRWIQKHRRNLYERIKQKLTPQTFGLFSALFLGHKTSETHEYAPAFRNWGISHYLARSGLHLMIIMLLWNTLLSFLQLSVLTELIIMISIVGIYTMLSWSSVSFLRALLMWMGHKLLRLHHLPYTTLDLLIVVAGIVLITNPINLMCLDFQLSFSLTAALICAYQAHGQKR